MDMGNQMSIETCYHVSLSAYPDLVDDTYTVKRTSGLYDDGWKISHQSDMEKYLVGPAATKHCSKDPDGTWRIFLDNKKSADEYVCGWRRLETIYPTRLAGEEIQKWRDATLLKLECLDKQRLRKLDIKKAQTDLHEAEADLMVADTNLVEAKQSGVGVVAARIGLQDAELKVMMAEEALNKFKVL